MTELSPEAKKLLRIAREEYSPADQRVASVRSALDARIASTSGGGGGAGGVGPAAAGALNMTKWLGLGLLAVAVSGATLIGVRSTTRTNAIGMAAPAAPDAPPAIAAPAQAAREVPAVAQGAQRQAVQDDAPVAAAVRKNKTVAPAQVTVAATEPLTHEAAAAPVSAPRAARAVRASTPPRVHTSPRVDRARKSDSLSLGSQQAAQPEAPAQAAAVVERDQAPAAPEPSKAVDDSLAREIALLKRARTALDRNDPRAALALADEHASQFASGVMRQERLATRVLALCALHRRAEAIDAKHELERIAPRSPHLMRLRTSCAAENEAHEVK